MTQRETQRVLVQRELETERLRGCIPVWVNVERLRRPFLFCVHADQEVLIGTLLDLLPSLSSCYLYDLSSLLTTDSPTLACFVKLVIPCCEDLAIAAEQLVQRSYVTDRAV